MRFHRLGKLLREEPIFGKPCFDVSAFVIFRSFLMHSFEGVEPQSEGRQLKLKIIQFLRSLVVPLIHDDVSYLSYDLHPPRITLPAFRLRRVLADRLAAMLIDGTQVEGAVNDVLVVGRSGKTKGGQVSQVF